MLARIVGTQQAGQQIGTLLRLATLVVECEPLLEIGQLVHWRWQGNPLVVVIVANRWTHQLAAVHHERTGEWWDNIELIVHCTGHAHHGRQRRGGDGQNGGRQTKLAATYFVDCLQ